jgi:hypothetical protein
MVTTTLLCNANHMDNALSLIISTRKGKRTIINSHHPLTITTLLNIPFNIYIYIYIGIIIEEKILHDVLDIWILNEHKTHIICHIWNVITYN